MWVEAYYNTRVLNGHFILNLWIYLYDKIPELYEVKFKLTESKLEFYAINVF